MIALLRFMIWAGMISVSSFAHAECDLNISAAGDTVLQDYNSLDRDVPSERIRLFLYNAGSASCHGFLRFDGSGTDQRLVNTSGQALQYWIAAEHDFGQILFDGRSNLTRKILVALKPGIQTEISPNFIVRPGQRGRSGTYQSEIDVLFSYDDFSQPDHSLPITLTVNVIPSVQANFVGGASQANGKNYTLDMGEISPGMARSLGLQLRANTTVDVEMSSENSGYLVHDENPQSKIGYSIQLGSHRVDLSRNENMTLPSNLSPDGITNPVKVKINNFTRAEAGTYSDTVLVRISAR